MIRIHTYIYIVYKYAVKDHFQALGSINYLPGVPWGPGRPKKSRGPTGSQVGLKCSWGPEKSLKLKICEFEGSFSIASKFGTYTCKRDREQDIKCSNIRH